jgi:ABC-2 type transport system permease protein
VFITYFRKIVLYGEIPSLLYHAWMLGYTLIVVGIGALVYKKNNHKFLYYV